MIEIKEIRSGVLMRYEFKINDKTIYYLDFPASEKIDQQYEVIQKIQEQLFLAKENVKRKTEEAKKKEEAKPEEKKEEKVEKKVEEINKPKV